MTAGDNPYSHVKTDLNNPAGLTEVVMKKLLAAVTALAVGSLAPLPASAAPDQYLGDLSIYGASGAVPPNVLIIIDNSGSMQDKVPGDPYIKGTIYPGTKNPNAVYSSDKKTLYISNITSVTTTCGGANPNDLLATFGAYRGRSLSSTGSCNTKGSGTYYFGNYLNYLEYLKTTNTITRAKIDIAREVVKEVIATTSGIKFGVMVFKYSGGTGYGGQFLDETISGAGGTKYVSTVKDMDAIFTGTITNRTALIATVGEIRPQGNTPLGETLFEAMRYYSGGESAFGNVAALTNGKFTSPVEFSCQKNAVIFITDGMSNADNDPILKTLCNKGDCDGDGVEPTNMNHVLDDVAKTLKDGPQKVTTNTIGFGLDGSDTEAVVLLSRAADSDHGGGAYYNTRSQKDLIDAIGEIITKMQEVDTSIAAPVAAPSPENRSYGSGRIFMGCFKPSEEGAFWKGNLKKYGILSGTSKIIDASSKFATYVDQNNDGNDDNNPTESLPPSAANGTFRDGAKSFWSESVDGSFVDKGGVGEMLLKTPANSRKIYTVLPAGTNLVEFTTTNTNITATMLGVTDPITQTKLINFIRGQDVNDEDDDGDTTDNRKWTMGDVIHSKPLVVNYASFDVTTEESKCDKNKSIIYVGGNDGMLHAFRDCNGSELWGFIPPTLLENLKYLKERTHTSFVDSTPTAYIHDVGTIGKIDRSEGDLVILVFGTRRGGGAASTKSGGAYFALDVTEQDNPRFLWKIVSNPTITSGITATPGFEELGESWSEPKFVKMKVKGTDNIIRDKIVAVIGGGYDNVNEDGRYGKTQLFTRTGTVSRSDLGDGAVTSAAIGTQLNPKGRGIYFIEIGTFGSSGLTLAAGVNKIAEFTPVKYPSLAFSFPSEIAAIDVNNNGYTSRLYASDTGGNIWRFDVGASDPANWTARKLFSSNPGYGNSKAILSDVGRKIFSKPSVVSEYGYKMLFFGTGDREHPLNTAVVDRIYAVKDTGKAEMTENDLVDVTDDKLQWTTDTSGAYTVKNILDRLDNANGWYIKLDKNGGEKVLSSPLIFNKVAYFTSHTPGTAVTTDPCKAPQNLGTGRLYALSYKTGEAVINYDKSNDTFKTENTRAKTGGVILLDTDRVVTIGSGIPSGPGFISTSDGGGEVTTGGGRRLGTWETTPGGGIFPLYWRQK
ncbi:Type IV pilus biogenesis factor PilY1 [Anaerolineae bacterium]|nr:Type IV pilus biogenesis factor PilY1 [Anaerolineae bacterium]